jgi:hypothetical protein
VWFTKGAAEEYRRTKHGRTCKYLGLIICKRNRAGTEAGTVKKSVEQAREQEQYCINNTIDKVSLNTITST